MKKKIIPVIALSMALVACGTGEPIPWNEMLPAAQVYQQIPVNKELQGAVKLGDVRAAEDKTGNVLHKYATSVSLKQKDYREAIRMALFAAKMQPPSGGKEKYILDANLQPLDFPFGFFSLTITSVAHYQLRRADDNRIVMDETLKFSFKVSNWETGPDPDKTFRLLLAGAIAENIAQMLRVLSAKSDAELLGKGV